MQIAEFIEETNRLEKFYEKELDEFQRGIWFQSLKSLSVQRYRQVINQGFNKCKFMPKLADIISLNQELPYNTEKKQIEKVSCERCNGLGLIFYWKHIEDGERVIKYQYATRCNCKNGLNYLYDGTKISDEEYKSKYCIALADEIALGGER